MNGDLPPFAAALVVDHSDGGLLFIPNGKIEWCAALADGVDRDAPLEQQRDDVGAALGCGGVERCPAAVRAAGGLGALAEEECCRLELIRLGGPVQRRGLMFAFAKMYVCPVAQPGFQCIHVAVPRGEVNRKGGPFFCAERFEQRLGGGLFVNSREVQRRAVGTHRAEVFAEFVEQLDDGVLSIDGSGVERRPSVRCRSLGIRATGQQQLCGFQAAVRAGQVECVDFFLRGLGVDICLVGQQCFKVVGLVVGGRHVQGRLA